MTTEPTSIMAPTAFAITCVLAAGVLLKASIPAKEATKRLKSALAQEGADSSFIDAFAFRKGLYLRPSSIRNNNDSKEVRDAKDDLIVCAERFPSILLRAMLVAVLGTATAAGLGVLEFYIRK